MSRQRKTLDDPSKLNQRFARHFQVLMDRAGLKAGNKGFEAATAAIEMVSLRRKLVEGGSA